MFSTYFEKTPQTPTPRGWGPGPGPWPGWGGGALGVGGGVFFQNILKTDTCFQIILKLSPRSVFKMAHYQFFQTTNIYKGTQVTMYKL